jgi:hypothetical protein
MGLEETLQRHIEATLRNSAYAVDLWEDRYVIVRAGTSEAAEPARPLTHEDWIDMSDDISSLADALCDSKYSGCVFFIVPIETAQEPAVIKAKEAMEKCDRPYSVWPKPVAKPF